MKNIFGKNVFLKFNILCFCICVLFLSACTADHSAETDRLKVVAVNFYQYDFAKNICKDMADVSMIIKPGAEVHGYEPSLSDIVAIEDADVFIYNGGESDAWIERILSALDTDTMTVVSLMDIPGITLYEEETHTTTHSHSGDFHSHEHKHDTGSKAYDEHIWTSPRNAMVIAEAICDAISQADEKNAHIYRANEAELQKELVRLDTELTHTVAHGRTNLIAVADRFPFLYMAKDYGLEFMAAFSGCSPESDAGPKAIASMIEEIQHHKIKTVFHIEMSNQKMADAICRHSESRKRQLHSCQNVSRAEFESGVGYVELMDSNIKNLKEALE